MRRLIPALAALSVLGAAPPALAADIDWAPPITNEFVLPYIGVDMATGTKPGDSFDFKNALHIHIRGEIAPGDAETFRNLITDKASEIFDPITGGVNMRPVVVSLDSDGGDFYEGLKLSDSIRGFATFVGKGDRCLSACAIAFLGGSERMLRGYPMWNARYVHTEGVVGFHAPFSSLSNTLMIPDGTPFSGTLGNQIATQFYAQAQDAINELTKRMGTWNIAPGFVFEMIGKKFQKDDDRPLGEQYLLINSYNRLDQTKTTVLADRAPNPANVDILGAINACEFLVFANTGRRVMTGPPVSSEAIPEHGLIRLWSRYSSFGYATEEGLKTSGNPRPRLKKVKIGPLTANVLLPAAGDDSYYLQAKLAGPGRVDCNVFRDADGQWYVKTYNIDIHDNDTFLTMNGTTATQRDVLDYKGPYPINDFTILGPDGVWNNFPAIEPSEELTPILAQFPDITGPSFDCTGKLDPAAEVICLIRPLGQLDGVLGKLYPRAVAKDAEGTKQSQRHWLKIRDRACRPGGIDTNDPLQFRSLIDCLTYFYEMRLRELDQIASAN
ncbi:hypothetical protein [Thioclava electrotropha]|uniref:Lysozyme inhibitor LprI N-terminal domain-containing protein n=1 Tax=Thioclava electrotropha TaxID=1549850 RepID=A0ABX6YWG7_9RHOB|nr:hypothetical protein [Thioclava electrotropha]QPZ92196.1 hypothetical protein AKL02_015740 [Thioclava electrotropha]